MAILRQKDFATNVAKELRFLDLAGEQADGNYGPQIVFRTSEGQFYTNPEVGEIIRRGLAEHRVQTGEPVDVVKSEVDLGRGRKTIRWQVNRVGDPVAAAGSVQHSAAAVYGQQPNGTFVVPALPGASVLAPTPAVESRQATSMQPNGATSNGNGSANGGHNGNGHFASEQPAQAHLGWVQYLISNTNALIDAQAACAAYASQRYGNLLKTDDVRALLTTAFINIAGKKTGGVA